MFNQTRISKDPLQSSDFLVGDRVVYPTHGVGIITGEEKQVVAGMEITVYVVSFLQDKMIVRVPKNRASKVGLRLPGTKQDVEMALKVLQSKIKKGKDKYLMWSKKAKRYESLIHSGSLILLAEVIRDLFRNEDDERSYSEKQIYDTAMSRFIQEYCVIMDMPKELALQKINSILRYKTA